MLLKFSIDIHLPTLTMVYETQFVTGPSLS